MYEYHDSIFIFSCIQDDRTEQMKGQTDEPIYAEANNNFAKGVSGLGNTVVSGIL